VQLPRCNFAIRFCIHTVRASLSILRARNSARNGVVRLRRARATTPGVPRATIVPPSSPAPGPTSITQSLAATTRMSCSTTMTVFPASTSASNCPELRSAALCVGAQPEGKVLASELSGALPDLTRRPVCVS